MKQKLKFIYSLVHRRRSTSREDGRGSTCVFSITKPLIHNTKSKLILELKLESYFRLFQFKNSKKLVQLQRYSTGESKFLQSGGKPTSRPFPEPVISGVTRRMSEFTGKTLSAVDPVQNIPEVLLEQQTSLHCHLQTLHTLIICLYVGADLCRFTAWVLPDVFLLHSLLSFSGIHVKGVIIAVLLVLPHLSIYVRVDDGLNLTNNETLRDSLQRQSCFCVSNIF